MPEAMPLMPIAHWRSGKPPMLIVRMLKTKSLRQWHGMAFVEQADHWSACLKAPDALDCGPFW